MALKKRLGMRELETRVLDILWDSKRGLTPSEVRERLPGGNRLAYTTVTTVLARLWKKKILSRRRAGRTFTYKPRESRTESAGRRMQEILSRSGDRQGALANFLEAMPPKERAQLRQMLGRRLRS